MSQTESEIKNILVQDLTSFSTQSDKIHIIQDIQISTQEVNQIVDSNILKNELGEFLNFDFSVDHSEFLDVSLSDFSDISESEENDNLSEKLFHIKPNIELKNISNCSAETQLNLFNITKKKFTISKNSIAKLKSLCFYLNYMSKLKPTEENFVRLSNIFTDLVDTL